MKISREKASQRLHHRVTTPLSIVIDGHTYSAKDWSMGGFCVAIDGKWHGEQQPDSEHSCYFKLPFQGFDIAFDIRIKLVRISEEKSELGFIFLDLSERQTELLQHFIEQLVRGSMVPIGDTILRIDSPVTPVSTKPDPSPVDEVPVKRWPAKLIGMSLFYFVTGIILFSYMLGGVYENFISLKVDNAVTASPVEPLLSLVDGRIHKVNVRQDELVTKEQLLFEIDSPNITKRISDAKTELERKKLDLDTLRKKRELAIELGSKPSGKEVRLFDIDIERLKQEITLVTEEVLILYEYRDSLKIASPDAGRIVDIFRDQGAIVKKGETIGLFERLQVPRIHVYLTESEAKGLSLQQRARVHILAIDSHWQAKIINIKPDKAFLSNREYQYRPVKNHERTVIVELELIINKNSEALPGIRSGLPVSVLFPATRISRMIPTVFKGLFVDKAQEKQTPQVVQPQQGNNYGI